MDAETRHKLKTNEFGEAIERLITFNDPRLKYWLGAIVVIALAVGGYRLWTWNQRNAVATAWRDLSQIDASGNAQRDVVPELQALIDNNSDPQLRAAARLRLGYALVKRYNAGAGDESVLRQAETALKEAAADSQTPAPLAASALLLQGTVYESLHDWDQARRAYETLKEPRFDGIPARGIAMQRIDTLPELARQVQFLPGNTPPPPDTSVGPQPEPATQPATAPATPPGGTPTPGGTPATGPAAVPAPGPATQPANKPPLP